MIKVAILGSTGSIGKTTLEVISKDKRNFDVVLLTANNGQELMMEGIECDGESVLGGFEHQDYDQWKEWNKRLLKND